MSARYITGLADSVDPTDRGIAYGDGLFETIAVFRGRVVRLELHLDRLATGCERLQLPMPDRTELEQHIHRSADGVAQGYVKLILTRGPGERGYAPPAAPIPTVILLSQADLTPKATEISVATLSLRLGENENLAGIKHLNRLEQVLGRLELEDLDADEGLMLSTSGHVIGGTSRNLFAVFGDRLQTPSLKKAGIAGVMRRAVLEHCAANNIHIDICDLSPGKLVVADEIFMTNALVGIQSVASLDDTDYPACDIATRLRLALDSSQDGQNERA